MVFSAYEKCWSTTKLILNKLSIRRKVYTILDTAVTEHWTISISISSAHYAIYFPIFFSRLINHLRFSIIKNLSLSLSLNISYANLKQTQSLECLPKIATIAARTENEIFMLVLNSWSCSPKKYHFKADEWAKYIRSCLKFNGFFRHFL